MLNITFRRARILVAAGFSLLQAFAGAPATPSPASAITNQVNSEIIVLPDAIPDPLEPFNRAMWAVNEGAMKGVIQPTSKAYRVVVCPPIRGGIRNIGWNIRFPDRV